MNTLVWSPAIEAIEELVASGNLLNGCISAFAKADAVERLSNGFDQRSCYFITRWRVAELAKGVSDIEVYPFLRNLGIPLYISYRLHSKIYRFSNANVLCGSCNATASGLGLNENPNIETASLVAELRLEDEIKLKMLATESIRVTDDIYEEFKAAIIECPPQPPFPTSDKEIYARCQAEKEFLLTDLPATKTPTQLLEIIRRSSSTSDVPASVVADCVNYGLSLPSEEAKSVLASYFRNSEFVKAIVAEIRSRKEMSFGAVTSFVHDRCRDVPSPHRRDVKECVNTLYNWLCYFFDDLTWDVPGTRSQVIRSDRPT